MTSDHPPLTQAARAQQGPTRQHFDWEAVRGPQFFHSGSTLTNERVLLAGPGTPMNLENVNDLANRMDISLEGIEVLLVNDPVEIAYLDYMGACAYTPHEFGGEQIRLGPASFIDEETLAATVAHEHAHTQQLRAGRHEVEPLTDLEDEAYNCEGPALERLRGSAT